MNSLITQGLSLGEQSIISMGFNLIGGSDFTLSSNIISPTISADALVVVNVFDAVAYTPSDGTVRSHSIAVEIVSPNVYADAIINVVVFSVAETLQNALVGDVGIAVKQSISTSVLQPIVTGEKKKQKTYQKGWPYDARNSLGAGAFIPIGIVSGNRSPYITIQFKICGDNFPCEEGIYQKESGLRSTVKIGIDKIRRKIKKSSVKIKGNIIRQKSDGLNIEFLKLEKV